MEGWIKSYRKFQNWEWYKTPNMFHLFHHLLYIASHKDGKWHGIEIKRGQAITGLNKLKASTGISVRSLRTCINRLKSTHELTVQTTHKYSIITICNYDKYNSLLGNSDTVNDTQSDTEATQYRHSSDNIQELREDKKVEKSRIKKAEILKKIIEEDNLKREQETEMFIENLMKGNLD